MRGPGRGRRYLQRFIRDHHGGDRIVRALRLDEQSTQAEQPRVLALGHGAEGALGAVAVAFELRRLRRQQQCQRIVAGMAARIVGMRRAADASPWPIASRPCVMAWRPRAWRRSRRRRRMRSGVRHSAAQDRPERMRRTTMTMPSTSMNTGSAVSARQPPQDNTTSPGWSAIHAAPAARGCDQSQEQNDADHEIPIGCRERGRGVGSEFARGGKRRVTRIGLVEPGLRGGTIGRRQRVQLAPRFVEIVAQRRRGDPRHYAGAIGAGRIGALDAHELCRARLQAIDDAAAAGGLGFRSRPVRASARWPRVRGTMQAALGMPEAANASSGLSASGFGASDFAAASCAAKGSPWRTRRRAARPHTRRRSATSSAGFASTGFASAALMAADFGLLRLAPQALDLRNALLIGERSTGAARRAVAGCTSPR